MDLLGASWAYALLFAFGAFAVGVHAYSLYGQRLPGKEDGNPGDPLGTIALPMVVGRGSFMRGFALYLVASEFLYLVLTSSSVILELSLKMIGRDDMVGALSADMSLNPLYPILASTVVVTASQLRPLAEIERAFRSVAHHLAGMPRNLFEIQERIRSTAIRELTKAIREGESRTPGGDLVGNAEKHAEMVAEVALAAGVGEFERKNFRTSIERVHCLYEWTLGYDGEQIWSGESTRPITSLFDSLKLEFRSFRSDLESLVDESQNLAHESERASRSVLERWEKVIGDCRKLEQRLTVVLSLLLLNRPDVRLDNYRALGALRDTVIRPERGTESTASAALGLSLLLGTALAFASVTGYLALEKGARDLLRESPAEAGIVAKGPLVTPVPLPSRSVEPATEAWWQVVFGEVTSLVEFVGGRMDDAFFETLDFAVIFAVSASIALTVRASRIEQKRWRAREAGGAPPVGTYLYIGLLAYLLSTVTFLVAKFLVLNVLQPLQSGSRILDPISVRAFDDYLPDIVLVPLIAFACVWFFCSHLDLHPWKLGRYAPGAFVFAFGCASFNLIQKIVRESIHTGSELWGSLLIPLIVLFCLFAAYIRIHERFEYGSNSATLGTLLGRSTHRLRVARRWRSNLRGRTTHRAGEESGRRPDAVSSAGSGAPIK